MNAIMASSPSTPVLINHQLIYSPATLFIRELKCILAALNSPQPLGKGYWISTSWLANAKKYFEAINIPNIEACISNTSSNNSRKTPTKTTTSRKQKIRARRGSDALPPWPSMTADILCSHSNLNLVKSSLPGSKRRLIDSRSWFFLRKFYPHGPQFKSNSSVECELCTLDYNEAKANELCKKEAEIKERRDSLFLNNSVLEALANRKNGVPAVCITSNLAAALLGEIEIENELSALTVKLDDAQAHEGSERFAEIPVPSALSRQSTTSSTNTVLTSGSNAIERFNSLDLSQPLIPGLYNIVPRSWLKAWRQYSKDASVKALPPLDCSSLLCHAHGQLVVPPHLEEFLIGVRKYLVQGLGVYPGDIVEILSADEWDALVTSLPGGVKDIPDFTVRFSLDGEGITWNNPCCMKCDPFDYQRRYHGKILPLSPTPYLTRTGSI